MKFWPIIFIFLFSSCGMFSSNEGSTYLKSKNIANGFDLKIPNNWEKIKTEGSDYALKNKKTNSIILLNSACRKYEASSLNALTSSMLTGIDDLNILAKNQITLHDREAQEVRVEGKVDGVKTYFNIITLQKNYCIYDYILISPNLKKIENDYSTFKLFYSEVIPE